MISSPSSAFKIIVSILRLLRGKNQEEEKEGGRDRERERGGVYVIVKVTRAKSEGQKRQPGNSDQD